MFPATLFDFNGVLVDDEHVHLEAFRDAVRPLGISISEKEYWDELLGFDDVGGFEHMLKKAGLEVTPEKISQLVEDKRPHYMRRARETLKTFPGAERVVRACAASGPVAVVSGALTDEIEFGLETLNVRDLVPKIISAEDTTISKPDPQGYQMGIEWLTPQIGEAAKRALVIEDSLDGIASAKAAGLPILAVAHSYSREELEASPADLVLDRLEEVNAEILASLHKKLYGG